MTDISTLVEALDLEVGFGELDSSTLLNLLKAGVAAYNNEAVNEFVLDDVILDREADSMESRAILLWALYIYLRGETNRASKTAIKISNPAGSTDVKNVEWAFAKRMKEVKELELIPLMRRIQDRGVVGEVSANEISEVADYTALSPFYIVIP